MGAAFAFARRRWQLVAFLAAVNLALAFAAAGPLSAALTPIDWLPAARAIVGGDDGLALELANEHPELFRVAGAGAWIALTLNGLFFWILAGGLLDPGAGVIAGAAKNARLMLKIGALGLLVRLACAGLAGAAWFAVKPLWDDQGFGELLLGLATVALVAGAAWSLGTVAIDRARGLALRDPSLPAWRALGRGLRRLRQRRMLAIAAFSGLGWLALTLAYHTIAYALPNAPSWAFALLMLLRALVAFGRAFVTVVALVAAGSPLTTD
jgi:hypothetical protein